MSHRVVVPPGTAMTFPFAKSGPDPIRITFTHESRVGAAIAVWSYEVAHPVEPMPDVRTPHVVNDTKEEQFVVIRVESGVTGEEIAVGKRMRFNKSIAIIGFGAGHNDEHILVVFACQQIDVNVMDLLRCLIWGRGRRRRRALQSA